MKDFYFGLGFLLAALTYLFLPPVFHDADYVLALGEWAEIAMWTYLTVVIVVCLILKDADEKGGLDE